MARILVIDDDPQNREILRLRLQAAGYSVEEAPCGEEGLVAAQKSPPDLVFLDVMMPRKDGWQVCRALKKNPSTKNVPVVLLSSLGQPIEQLRGWESGADEYITKPWTNERILEVVANLLGKAEEQAS